MLRKTRIISIFIGCIIFLSVSQEGFANRKSDFEVFIGGTRYLSFKEYQIKRLKSTLKLNYISSEYKNFSQYKEGILKKYNEKNYRGITKEEVLHVLNELDGASSSEDAQMVDNSLDEMKEMQQMLKGYNYSQSNSKKLSIDPDKLKTIVVQPSVP